MWSEQIGGFAMIQTRIIPVATATEQEFLVEITENVCKAYCVGGTLPVSTVEFVAGAAQVVNGNAIVPIVAKVIVATPNSNGCGCAHTQVFTERFDIAFTATATNAVTLTPGTTVLTDPAYVRCCKARGVRITTTLTATIA